MWQGVIHANSYPMEITRDTRKYKFTNGLNTMSKTNLVWKDSHNINNKVIGIYHTLFKMVIVFEK